MAVNKVVYGNETLMDITDTTVNPGNVVVGNVFYSADGSRQVGSLGVATELQDGLMSALDKAKLDGIDIEWKTAAEWAQDPSYIPVKNKILIYTDTNNIKIGDGLAYAVDLPFVTDAVRSEMLAALSLHALNTEIHITDAERTFWNNKLNYELDGETLTLNRN